ncbi:hypothetical protein GQ54DRAFT_311070 [Martensiomyces pterosporus]|nr:hypothetical protein GQ54DRAFT_311070 [Martensiomyces pterosporus]
MQRLPRYLVKPKSVSGRVRAILQASQAPVAQSIAQGLEEAKRIKLAVKQKVAWQHASPMFVPHSHLLEQAINRGSPHRIQLVLKRMLNDHIKWGKPVGVTPGLLDRCMERLLANLLSKKPTFLESALEAADTMSEIAWWTRHNKRSSLWTMASAVAHDLRGDRDQCRDAVYSLVLAPQDTPLLTQVISSPAISHQLLADLHSCALRTVGVDLALAAEFYISAMKPEHPVVPRDIGCSVARHHDTVAQALSNGSSLGSMWRPAVALTHFHIAHGNHELASLLLSHFGGLTVPARWPMSASSMAIKSLLSTGNSSDACRLLQCTAAKRYSGFVALAKELPAFSNASLEAQLLKDELDIRLHSHSAPDEEDARAPPKTAFFVPTLRPRMSDANIAEYFAGYYKRIEQVVSRNSSVDLAGDLVSEAGSWTFRTQSYVPMDALTAALAKHIQLPDDSSAAHILLQYTRTLRSFGLVHYTSRKGIPSGKENRISLTPLSATESHHWNASYKDMLYNFRHTRRVVLAEYLRRGLEPPPEALAVFSGLLAATNEHESQEFSARILPQILPEMTGSEHPSRMAAQAYYERMLLSCSTRPRRLIQLLTHLVGHSGVNSPEFLRRLVDLTVVTYLRHGHFLGFGFFHLEKAFIRFVSKPRFSTAYLNTVRPRFWALHMFLRKQRYVPRLKLHKRQFRVHKYKTFEMQATSIPSEGKLKDQKVDTEIAPIRDGDIETAIRIFTTSPVPEGMLGTERYSLERMVKKQTRVIRPKQE